MRKTHRTYGSRLSVSFFGIIFFIALALSACDRNEESPADTRERAEETFDNIRERTGETFGNLWERLGETFGNLRERIAETYGDMRDRQAPETPVPVFAVNTIPAAEGPIQDYLALSGDIIASSTVDAFSDIAGRVSRVYVAVGSRVNRNDALVAVDPSRPGMEFVPSVVRAPVAGTIVALPSQLGMTISPAVPLARISGDGGLEIRLFVAERFISRISLNQPCEIILDAWPGYVFRGAVTELSPTVDPSSRTMEIRVGVENPGAMLRAGMFAKVRVITEQREDIVKIPIGAMVSRFGEQYVFAVDYSDPEIPVARRRDVVPGIQIDGVMEVRQGLAPNEEVVVRGQSLLEDGSRINIVGRLAPLN
ncbi:MAG: efflux RND transporter periplasmic adaptor subunit [Treponema sp.]|nr:efflux RND transporter periplasmic adaptor subunit [Treponema sp.]